MAAGERSPMRQNKKAFGAELRRLRLEAGLTARGLASLLEEAGGSVSDQSILGWERGDWAPMVDHVLFLERVLCPPYLDSGVHQVVGGVR